MSTLPDSFNAPVVVTVDNTEYSFKKLSVTEVAEYCATLKQRKVASVRQFADECEIKGVERFKVLRAVESEDPIIQDVWFTAQTPQGSIEVALKSAVKSGMGEQDAKALFAKMNPQEVVKLALQLTGYVLEVSPDEKKEPSKSVEPEGYQK